jgi:hypothetical protein
MGGLTAIGRVPQFDPNLPVMPVLSGRNEVDSMQRIYLGIAFLSVMALVFTSLIALDKMIGG